MLDRQERVGSRGWSSGARSPRSYSSLTGITPSRPGVRTTGTTRSTPRLDADRPKRWPEGAGAALGDPARFANAGAAYRYSGLAPTSYESARRRATTVRISKVGSVELRQAMIALGTGIALHHPDFAAYKRRLLDAGKKPIVATIAVAHRAHRLAFAVIRSQQPYDAAKWAASTASRQQRDRPVTAAHTATGTT